MCHAAAFTSAECDDLKGASMVNPSRNRYPYSIVWGPLCPITCCCPCVGHMGIGDSHGRIHDFQGPYCIGCDNFMVGSVWRYAIVSGPGDNDWDASIDRANAVYSTRIHNICCDNCHHHTAMALVESGRHYGLLSAWLRCCLVGKCSMCSS